MHTPHTHSLLLLSSCVNVIPETIFDYIYLHHRATRADFPTNYSSSQSFLATPLLLTVNKYHYYSLKNISRLSEVALFFYFNYIFPFSISLPLFSSDLKGGLALDPSKIRILKDHKIKTHFYGRR